MRVIGGYLKGRTLVSFQNLNIRPMSNMVKESVFNIINFKIQNSSVLDLFSGTGSLSIESASRGAKNIIAVDSGKNSVNIIRKNVEKFNLSDSITVCRQDAFKFLKKCTTQFDIVFVDPPFVKKISDKIVSSVSNSDVIHKDSMLFIQVSKHDNIKDSYGKLFVANKKSYSDKHLIIFKVKQ